MKKLQGIKFVYRSLIKTGRHNEMWRYLELFGLRISYKYCRGGIIRAETATVRR